MAWGSQALESTRAAEDLVEVLGLPAALIAVGGSVSLQVVGGPVELATVLENVCQGGQRLFAVPWRNGSSAIARSILMGLNSSGSVNRLMPVANRAIVSSSFRVSSA